MKLSINQGPLVGGVDAGFSIPHEHCRELSNFLWDWVSGLPEMVSEYIEVITINPLKIPNAGQRVVVKVVLSYSYDHVHLQRTECVRVRSDFEVHLFCYSAGSKSVFGYDGEGPLKELNDYLVLSLKKQQGSFQSVATFLEKSLVCFTKDTSQR